MNGIIYPILMMTLSELIYFCAHQVHQFTGSPDDSRNFYKFTLDAHGPRRPKDRWKVHPLWSFILEKLSGIIR
jgi:hypothetical protein